MKDLSDYKSLSDKDLNNLVAIKLDGCIIGMNGYLESCLYKGRDEVLAPHYCSSRDLAFDVRKNFSIAQEIEFEKAMIELIDTPKAMLASCEFWIEYLNSSPRDQVIAALYVLNQEEKV